MRFLLDDWRNRRGQRLTTIFGKRLAGKKNGFFRGSAGCGGTGNFGRAMVKTALRRTTRFETTWRAATIFRTALAAVFLATVVVAT
jgi:hypothetical protein